MIIVMYLFNHADATPERLPACYREEAFQGSTIEMAVGGGGPAIP